MKKIFLIISILIISFDIYSQAPANKIWDFRYGGPSHDLSAGLVQTLDHGFLLAGSSLSIMGFDKSDSSQGDYDYWIVKTDDAGNKLWDKTYGGSDQDLLTAVIALPDSGFLLGGNSYSGISGDKSEANRGTSLTYDIWIIRIDKNGNKLWDKTFGGDDLDRCYSLLVLNNGNFLIGGYTLSDSTGDMSHHNYGNGDYWIIKIDANGNKIWDKNYGGSQLDFFKSLLLTPDNGIILGGSSSSPVGTIKSQSPCNITDGDYWILKIDSNGNKLWDKTYGGPGEDNLFSTLNLSGNKLLLGGTSKSLIGCEKSVMNHGVVSTVEDFWFVCTDSSGNKLWDKVYGGFGAEDALSSVSLINNGILISGTSYSSASGDKTENNNLAIEQSWVIAVDTSGNKIWDKTLHCPTHTEMCYGLQTDDGCFVFLSSSDSSGGYCSQNRNSLYDYWLLKFCFSANLPTASFVTSASSLCQNTCLDFINYSQNVTSYQWLFPGGTPSSDTSANPQGICYFNSGNFDVTLIASNSNGSDTFNLPNYLTIYPQVQFSPLVQHGDTIFSTPGYTNYQWYFDSTLIAGQNNYFYIAQQSGDYSVVVTDSNNCNATAQIINVIASVNDLNNVNNDMNARYSSGIVYLNLKSSLSTSSYINITDVSGKTIFERYIYLDKGNNTFDLQTGELSDGVYFILMENGIKKMISKLFIW